MKKTFNIHLPDYLTLEMFKQIQLYKGDDIGKIVNVISSLIGIEEDVVRKYPIDLLRQINQDLEKLSLPNETFHALVEFNGTVYGYSDIHSMNLGAYIDLESYCKDVFPNLEKIAALLYRPVQKNRLKSLEFQVKQGIRVGLEKGIENPFDYYTIEEYDSESVKDRWKEMKDFPSHVLMGALSFFLAAASLYLNDTAYLQKKISNRRRQKIDSLMMQNLSLLTGGGGQLSTVYLNPVSYRSPEISL